MASDAKSANAACKHCGCAVEAGETECRRCGYWMMMAYVYVEAMRMGLDETIGCVGVLTDKF